MSPAEQEGASRGRPEAERQGFRGAIGTAARAVTPLGRLLLALFVLGLSAGLAFAWVEGWFLAVLAGALLLLALPFLLGARAYRTAILLRHDSVVAGGQLQLDVRVANTARGVQLPAIAELPMGDALRELVVPMLGTGGAVELPLEVRAERRGVIRVGPLTLARQDPFGLLRREISWREWHLVHIHPRTVPLPPNSAGMVRDLEGQASRRLSDADLSFHAVREYVPGDAVRHVHWKATAKTGTLMVRQYEESQSARVAVLFDAVADEYASDEEFELGVDVAASLSVQAVREGRERFVASAGAGRGAGRSSSARSERGSRRRERSVDGLDELPSRDAGRLLDAWAELGAVEDGVAVEALARGLARSRRPLSVVAIVTGSRPELARLRRAASAFPAGVRVLVVRVEQLAEPRAQLIGPVTLMTVGALDDLPGLMFRGLE